MIDDPDTVTTLMASMKEALPIPATPQKNVLQFLRDNPDIGLRANQRILISKVFYLGDDGGIMCGVEFKGLVQAVVISLTHLKVDSSHPLSKEIRHYQNQRTRKLAELNP